MAALRARGAVEAALDWQGGLIWARTDLPAETLRAELARQGGGHATLIRGDLALRQATRCFQPQEPGLAALTQRVKAAFDPMGILNPGRMG